VQKKAAAERRKTAAAKKNMEEVWKEGAPILTGAMPVRLYNKNHQ